MTAICPKCGGHPVAKGSAEETLFSYWSNCPHGNHDDNCLSLTLYCEQGHRYGISLRRSCPCGWVGKATCFCHDGEKVMAPEVLELPRREA